MGAIWRRSLFKDTWAVRRYRSEAMRALTIVNGLLWSVLFVAWLPYATAVGWADPISIEVRWILAATAFLQLTLFGLRMMRRRPVLG